MISRRNGGGPAFVRGPMRNCAILIGGLAVLAGCREAPAPDRPPERQPAAAAPSSDRAVAPPSATSAASPGRSAFPGVSKPASAPPVAAESAESAAQLVRTYFALVEKGRQAEAERLWEGESEASEFAADLRRYREYHAEVGPPGQMEGAAGSSYVAVPAQLHGRLKDGTPFRRRVEITLRRVNDVPGSTVAQRRWRIRAIASVEAAE